MGAGGAVLVLHAYTVSVNPQSSPRTIASQPPRRPFHCAIGYEVISVPVLICMFVKGGNHPRLQSDEISICILTYILGNTKQLVE